MESGMRPNPMAEFLESRETWAYLGYEDAMIFLRKSLRRIDGKKGLRRCLDLSALRRDIRKDNTRYDPKAVSTGFLARFMEDLEAAADRHSMDIHVERVINEWMPEWFERRGYLQVGEPDPPSFHRYSG